MPIVVRLDLQLNGTRIRLNLSRQYSKPTLPPLTITRFNGKSTEWMPSSQEITDTYEDQVNNAFATLVIKKVNGIEDILIVGTFNVGTQIYSITPGDMTEVAMDVPKRVDEQIFSAVVEIDGSLHSIMDSNVTDPGSVRIHRDPPSRLNRRSANADIEKRRMTVESLLVVDYLTFEKFLKQSKAVDGNEKRRDATINLMYFLSVLVKRVDNIYERTDFGNFSINVKWTETIILQSLEDDIFHRPASEKQDAKSVLTNFTQWLHASALREVNKKADFAYLITSMNMGRKLGNAYVRHICNTSCTGTSIFRSIPKMTVIFAHELAHNLGAGHVVDNCKADIMRPTLADEEQLENLQFSDCTISSIVQHINSLDNNCLLDGGEIERAQDSFLRLYPGQIHTLDSQCRIYNGPNSFYCGEMNFGEEICRSIKCANPDGNSCDEADFKLAFDGTSCSNGSWCEKNKCAQNYLAPRFTECQDTIRECKTLEPRDCYKDYYAITCCLTCLDLVQNPLDPGCLYGDRGTNCSNLLPAICDLVTHYCCDSCKMCDD